LGQPRLPPSVLEFGELAHPCFPPLFSNHSTSSSTPGPCSARRCRTGCARTLQSGCSTSSRRCSLTVCDAAPSCCCGQSGGLLAPHRPPFLLQLKHLHMHCWHTHPPHLVTVLPSCCSSSTSTCIAGHTHTPRFFTPLPLHNRVAL